jgi:hypothetical protein
MDVGVNPGVAVPGCEGEELKASEVKKDLKTRELHFLYGWSKAT